MNLVIVHCFDILTAGGGACLANAQCGADADGVE